LGRPEIRDRIKDLTLFEKALFQDFSKRYHAFSNRSYSNDWDLLALGQHYGLPTRLLDWTESALVAFWFASEKNIENNEYGVIWYYIPGELDIIEPKVIDDNNSKPLNPFNRKSTKVFCPDYISERITAQKGWFTCHVIVNNRFLKFESMPKNKGKLGKLAIDYKMFPEIRRKLNIMGINASTIYPDLIGLNTYLKWKHLKLDNEIEM